MRSAGLISRLSSDSLWLLLSRIALQLGMALFTVLLARGLGSAAFGEYAFIASIIFVGNVLTTFGTDMLLIREIASSDDLSGLAPALWIQLVLSVAFIALVFVLSAVLPAANAEAVSALRIYSLSMVPLAFYTVFTTALRGRQRMLAYAALNVALMAMQVLAAAWLFWRGGSLVELALALLLVQLAAALLANAICSFQFLDIGRIWQLQLDRVGPMLRASAPIALLGLLGVIYQRLTLLLLPGLAGAAATGWYSAGARVVEAAKIGHVAVFTALYPMMAQQRSRSGADWARRFRGPGLGLLVGAVLAACSLELLAKPLTLLLYGDAYLPAAGLIRILGWLLVPYSLNSFLTLAFLARGEEAAIVRALAVGTATLAILTAWWTPMAGASGAAWAAVCAEVVQAMVLLAMDVRKIGVLHSMAAVGEGK